MMKAGTFIGVFAALSLVAAAGFGVYQIIWKKKSFSGFGSGSGNTGGSGGSGNTGGSGGSGNTGGSGTPPAPSTPPAPVTGKATKVGQLIYAIDYVQPYIYQSLGTTFPNGQYFPIGNYIGKVDEIGPGYLKVTSYTGPPTNAAGQPVYTFYVPNKVYRLG